MKVIALEQADPGMELANDIEFNGKVVLTAGAHLTEKHLKILKAWGITKLNITTDRAHEDSEQSIPEEELNALKETLDARFEKSIAFNPEVAEIRDQILTILIERKTAGKNK